MRPIFYRDQLVALADGDDVLLPPDVGELPTNDPLRRFVIALCAFSAAIDAGDIDGPYTEERAAAHARTHLIPQTKLILWWDLDDADLAEVLNVPADEVRIRRAELRDRLSA